MLNVFVVFFGLWTLLCHSCVFLRLPFQTLCLLAPWIFLAAAALSFLLLRDGTKQIPLGAKLDPGNAGGVSGKRTQGIWQAACAIPIVLFLGSSYDVFWGLSLGFLAVSVIRLRPWVPAQITEPAPVTRRTGLILCSLAVTSMTLVFIAHRPDADDAFYVAVAADAVSHPELPVLAKDPMYGDHRLPLLLPVYAFSSIELLNGYLARTFGGEPILWAHTCMPLVLGALLPLAWAAFFRTLTRRWILPTGFVMIILLLLGEHHQSIGNFAFVRMFQGKAAFVSVMMPCLYALAFRFSATSSFRDWIFLALSVLSALGMSSSSIFVVPIILFVAIAVAWRSRWSAALGLFAVALYPLLLGFCTRGKIEDVAHLFPQTPALSSTLAGFCGQHGRYFVLFGVLAAPTLLEELRSRQTMTLLSLILFLSLLNPFLFDILSKDVVTPVIVWRLFWAFPIAGMAALVMSELLETARADWHRTGLAACIVLELGVLAWLSPYNSFRFKNHVALSFSPLKVPNDYWAVAKLAAAIAPADTAIVAPEEITVLIPALTNHPLLLGVRGSYDEIYRRNFSDSEFQERKNLRLLAAAFPFLPGEIDKIVSGATALKVGEFVMYSVSKDSESALIQHGFRYHSSLDGYALYLKSAELGPVRHNPRETSRLKSWSGPVKN